MVVYVQIVLNSIRYYNLYAYASISIYIVFVIYFDNMNSTDMWPSNASLLLCKLLIINSNV